MCIFLTSIEENQPSGYYLMNYAWHPTAVNWSRHEPPAYRMNHMCNSIQCFSIHCWFLLVTEVGLNILLTGLSLTQLNSIYLWQTIHSYRHKPPTYRMNHICNAIQCFSIFPYITWEWSFLGHRKKKVIQFLGSSAFYTPGGDEIRSYLCSFWRQPCPQWRASFHTPILSI